MNVSGGVGGVGAVSSAVSEYSVYPSVDPEWENETASSTTTMTNSTIFNNTTGSRDLPPLEVSLLLYLFKKSRNY